MSTILSVIDFPAILALPWYVGITGILAAGLLVWSAFWSLITLKIIPAFTRLVMALVVLIILSRGGEAILQFIGNAAAS